MKIKINLGGADRTGLCRKCSKPVARRVLRRNRGYCQGCRQAPDVRQ